MAQRPSYELRFFSLRFKPRVSNRKNLYFVYSTLILAASLLALNFSWLEFETFSGILFDLVNLQVHVLSTISAMTLAFVFLHLWLWLRYRCVRLRLGNRNLYSCVH